MVGHTLTWLPDMLNDYPRLQAYVQRITARDAYARAMQSPDINPSGGAS